MAAAPNSSEPELSIRTAMTLLFALTIPLAAAAGDSDSGSGTLFLYGAVKFEVRSDLGSGGRVVVIDSPGAGCEDLAWQAKLVLDQSETWISQRRAGLRRIAARDLIFFQYKGLRFRMPYEAPDTDVIHFYDSFELLGFLHARWKAGNCGRAKPPFIPAWPFGTREWPDDEAAITFTGLHKGRRLYVESFRGHPTDVYYCKKTMAEPELGKLRQKLLGVKASRRIEDSASFREYTEAREAVCGES